MNRRGGERQKNNPNQARTTTASFLKHLLYVHVKETKQRVHASSKIGHMSQKKNEKWIILSAKNKDAIIASSPQS